MCNCRTEIEKRLTEKFAQDEPEAREHKARLTGYALLFGETLKEKGAMPIELTAIFPLKKGGEKEKKSKSNMIFTYCPFCGEKYDNTDG